MVPKGAVMIELNKDVCSNLDAALHREWLETNGTAAFRAPQLQEPIPADTTVF